MAFMAPAHQTLDRELEHYANIWDGYVEPSSTKESTAKTAEKKASIFISEEDHAKLGLNIESNVKNVTQS